MSKSISGIQGIASSFGYDLSGSETNVFNIPDIINSRKHPVILNERTLDNSFDIYNAYEYWYKPNIYSLITSMQNVYHTFRKDKKAYKAKQQIGIDSSDQFTYESVGKKICT